MTRLLASAVLLIALAGCAPDLTALANDPAPVCVDFSTPWGSAHVNRYHGCDRP